MANKLDTSSLRGGLKRVFGWFNSSRSLIFFLALTSLYGYILWRINVLSTAPPTDADVASAQQSVPRPKISAETIEKLESLQDNSIRVQSLFNEARQNPFQE